jgi:hypothetical protein
MSQGVDIQLKILQTLQPLITNFPAVHGRLLANVRTLISLSCCAPTLFCLVLIGTEYALVALQALLLCSKLHESRTAVVSSTAAATLRQLVMFVVDKVIEDDRRLQLASELEPITPPDGTTQSLGTAARDAFAIFEDLRLLGTGERP